MVQCYYLTSKLSFIWLSRVCVWRKNDFKIRCFIYTWLRLLEKKKLECKSSKKQAKKFS